MTSRDVVIKMQQHINVYITTNKCNCIIFSLITGIAMEEHYDYVYNVKYEITQSVLLWKGLCTIYFECYQFCPIDWLYWICTCTCV